MADVFTVYTSPLLITPPPMVRGRDRPYRFRVIPVIETTDEKGENRLTWLPSDPNRWKEYASPPRCDGYQVVREIKPGLGEHRLAGESQQETLWTHLSDDPVSVGAVFAYAREQGEVPQSFLEFQELDASKSLVKLVDGGVSAYLYVVPHPSTGDPVLVLSYIDGLTRPTLGMSRILEAVADAVAGTRKVVLEPFPSGDGSDDYEDDVVVDDEGDDD